MHRHANLLLKSWQQLLSSGDAEGACCSLAFFLCFHWMIVQLQEGEKERNLLTAIHPLPVPHPRVQLCVFGACGNGYRLLPGCAAWWQLGWFCIPEFAMDRQTLTNYCDTFVT